MPEPKQEPKLGTNIHTIWTKVLTDEYLSFSQLKEKITKFFPSIPTGSFHIHTKALVKRGFADSKIMEGGVKGFRRYKKPIQPDLLPPAPRSYKKRSGLINELALKFLKKHIGKAYTASEVRGQIGAKGSGIWEVLKTFAINGCLDEQKSGKLTYYLVLPAIQDYTLPPGRYGRSKQVAKKAKPRREIIHIEPEQTTLIQEPVLVQELNTPNLLDMSVGQLGTYITTLRDENIKLKQTIETMVHLAIQAGVVDQE
jgi:hypothetical protein